MIISGLGESICLFIFTVTLVFDTICQNSILEKALMLRKVGGGREDDDQ